MSARETASTGFARRLSLLAVLTQNPRGLIRDEILRLAEYAPGEAGRRNLYRDREVLEGAGIGILVESVATRAPATWRLAACFNLKRFTRAA